MNTVKIGLMGAAGRMGQSIKGLIDSRSDKFQLAASLNSKHDADELLKFCQASDVIVDFSSANILGALTKAAANCNTNMVVGTTGLEDKHFAYLQEAATQVAVLYAANTSIGANLVAMLAAQSAKILKEYDVEIIEAHHRHKKDAPSGTALMIGQKIAEARKLDFQANAVFDRANKAAIRTQGEIGFSSIRAGGIYGEHEVMFAGDNELVTIGCRALSRLAFAEGALIAAQWISDKPPGLYSMQDVLQESSPKISKLGQNKTQDKTNILK